MQSIMGKLHLLNYEKDFCKSKGLRPIHEAYFIVNQNTAEQFNYFKA